MKKILFSVLIILIAISAFLFFGSFLNLEFSEIVDIPVKIIDLAEKRISTPPPLKIERDNQGSFVILEQQEIISLTNKQRQENGLALLRENSYLNISAEMKIDDMFENQYFSHDSLTGEGAGDLTKKVSYEFLFIGENLAMGNFESNQELVIAWMESPGHRENILSQNYQEIGIAVKKGVFNGKDVWMAVQHFGLPLSACPEIDESIKNEIKQKEERLNSLQDEILIIQSELRSIRVRLGGNYQQKVKEYNDLVEEYNAIFSETKLLIDRYNNQVQAFNDCVVRIE